MLLPRKNDNQCKYFVSKFWCSPFLRDRKVGDPGERSLDMTCHSRVSDHSKGLTPRQQLTFFVLSSNSFCLILVSFAILFIAFSLSSFKNSLRVNSLNCFLAERPQNQMKAFYAPLWGCPSCSSLLAPWSRRWAAQIRLVLSRSVEETSLSHHPLQGAGTAIEEGPVLEHRDPVFFQVELLYLGQ